MHSFVHQCQSVYSSSLLQTLPAYVFDHLGDAGPLAVIPFYKAHCSSCGLTVKLNMPQVTAVWPDSSGFRASAMH